MPDEFERFAIDTVERTGDGGVRVEIPAEALDESDCDFAAGAIAQPYANGIHLIGAHGGGR